MSTVAIMLSQALNANDEHRIIKQFIHSFPIFRQTSRYFRRIQLLLQNILTQSTNQLIMGNTFSHNDEKLINSQDLIMIQGKELNNLTHRSIGVLTCRNKGKEPVLGSGFLISKNIVLTAMHNIYCRQSDYQFSDLKFHLGTSETSSHHCYQVESVRYFDKQKSCNDDSQLKYDFAMLKLKQKVEYNQFLKLSLPCEKCLINNKDNTLLQIYGFPVKYNYQCKDKQGRQFEFDQYGLAKAGRIVKIDSQSSQISYGISALPGQSGCPVIIDQNIIAIHNGGGKANEDFNVGRLIDIPLFSALEQWCKELKGDPFQLNSKNHCPHIEPTLKKYLREKEEQRKRSILDLAEKGLKEINLTQEKHLTEVNLYRNQLSTIDVRKNINLTQLILSDNQLSEIDVSKNINLTQLYLWKNQLSEIDVRNNINLTHLHLSSNQLSAIDVNSNINLTHLDLRDNKISAIDVSNCTKLTSLSLQDNFIKSVLLSFSSLLYLTRFSDQQSAACEVKLLYNKENSQNCNERKKEWTEEYRKGGEQNKHGCLYTFICSKLK